MQWSGVSMLLVWLKVIHRQVMNALAMGFIHSKSETSEHAMSAYSLGMAMVQLRSVSPPNFQYWGCTDFSVNRLRLELSVLVGLQWQAARS